VVCPILVGRAPHLAALDACLDRTATGQRQILLITGEAGIGKSRLVREACARARGRGFGVVQGTCFETDRGLPYAPFLDLLSGVADADAAQLANLLQERPPSANASDIDFTRRRISQAFGALFKQLAAAQPVLLVLEDMHWSDEASIELLRILVRELAASPVLLLLTYRSDEVSPALRTLLASLDRTRVAFEIALQPLTLSEIDALLRAVFALDRPARADFLDLIGTLSEGNPFFIEEILSALIARGEIFLEGGQWERKPLPELHVPRTVWEAVQQRSANLSPTAAELLVLAAVVGRRFSLGLLQVLSDQDDATLIESIKELLGAGLVVEESAEQCAFRHALTREAVYGGLLGRERQALHRRVAELIESLHRDQLETLDDHLDLAHHYFEGAVWDKALRFGAAAGERALALYAPRAAIEQLSRALDAARRIGVDPVPVLSHARGLAHEMLGDFDAAREDLEAAIDGASAHGDEALLWRALLDLGLLWAGRDYTQTGTYVQQALEVARRLGDEASVAHSLNRLGNWHMNVQRIEDALACHHEALAIFEKVADRRGVAETLDLLGATSQQATDPARAAEYYDRALPLLRDLDDRRRMVNVMVLRTVLEGAYTIDRIEPSTLRGASALHDAEAALTMAREIGWRAGESFASWELALYLGPRGE
jgi:predicted ATPase